jgi:hypothetical protein
LDDGNLRTKFGIGSWHDSPDLLEPHRNLISKRRVQMNALRVRSLVALAALSVMLTSCDDTDAVRPQGSAAKPYLGETPPDTTAVIFAPQIVSSPECTEYSGSFSPDGTEYYFYRFSDSSPAQILSTRVLDGTWTEPDQVQITKGFPAIEPHVTTDNKWLLFEWDRQPLGFWASQRTDSGWAEPQFAGQGMYVTSDNAGNLYVTDMSSVFTGGGTYLAKVTFENGVFTGYERLNISTYYGQQAHPCIARDGSYILFDVSSGKHLYVSFRNEDGSWGDALDLAQHGFDPGAGGAYISPDGKYLFFFLNKDIWWVDVSVIEKLKPAGP